jgi:hypothetical protein
MDGGSMATGADQSGTDASAQTAASGGDTAMAGERG